MLKTFLIQIVLCFIYLFNALCVNTWKLFFYIEILFIPRLSTSWSMKDVGIYFTLAVPVSYLMQKNIYFTVHSANYACNFISHIGGGGKGARNPIFVMFFLRFNINLHNAVALFVLIKILWGPVK